MSRTSGVRFILSHMFTMAKGIVATLREALLHEGIALAIVNRMLHSRTGRLYFVLDSMEKLIDDVAHRTKLLLDQGKAEDYQTLAEAIESLYNPLKNVTVMKEPSESLKREIVENIWIPVKKLRAEGKQITDTFIIMRKKRADEVIAKGIKIKEYKPQIQEPKKRNTEANVSPPKKSLRTSGLDMLAQAAASCDRMTDLTTECPTLATLLNN